MINYLQHSAVKTIEIGSKAQVKISNGQFSQKFVNQIGTVIKCIRLTGRTFWVLRFPSSDMANEEGLFEEHEITPIH